MSKIVTDTQKIEELLSRRLENILPSKREVSERLAGGQKLRIYWGIDPTGTQVHMGHTIPILMLKQLAELGHEIILLIGDFTARIGDPTDKEAARIVLTEKEVTTNMATYLEQVNKIFPHKLFQVKYNSKWLKKLTGEKIIELGNVVTVQQLLQRDMFQKRIENEKEIYVTEFLYPLFQGYDAVVMEVDGEVGGNDQLFNMDIGRKLVKKMLGKDKLVFATRLLVDAASGKKMSKSEGGFIAINDAPKDIFEKVQNTVPDEMIKTVFELCTEVELEKIDWNKNPQELKEELAFELVRMYHGPKEAEKTKSEWRKEDEFPGGGKRLVEFISEAHGVSMSVAKDLINQKAVEVNSQTATDWNYEVKSGDVLKIGKKRPIKAI